MRAFVLAAVAVLTLPLVAPTTAEARPHRGLHPTTAGRRAEVRKHRVGAGESLREIADHYGCSLHQLRTANDLDGARQLHAGKRLTIPTCSGGRDERSGRPAPPARIMLEPTRREAPEQHGKPTRSAKPGNPEPTITLDATTDQSVGAPWQGSLRNATRFPAGKGYTLRHPARVWATRYTVALVRRAIADVRRAFPRLHTLGIGDFSARDGGAISDHHSHQAGRDVDLGLWFKKQPAGYPANFVAASERNLDCAATWALINSFARTAGQPGGVQVIFLDFKVQGLVYRWAKDHGVDADYLAKVFQFPHGRGELAGLVHHVPNHKDHVHVRFSCPPGDASCQ